MKKSLLPIILIITLVLSLTAPVSYAETASADGLYATVYEDGFSVEPQKWGNSSTYYESEGILGLNAKPKGTTGNLNANKNWPDGSCIKGLISYEFDYMIPSFSAITNSAQFGMRDSVWIDNSVTFFCITAGGLVRRGFGDNAWEDLTALNEGKWYTFKILLDTASGEYSVFMAETNETGYELLFRSEGRYSDSNPAANGVRGLTFVNFRPSGSEQVDNSAYVDNVCVRSFKYACEWAKDSKDASEFMNVLKAYSDLGFIGISEKNLDFAGENDVFEAVRESEITSDAELESVIRKLISDKKNKTPNDYNHNIDYENKIIYVTDSTLSPERFCHEIGIDFERATIYMDSSLNEPGSYYVESGNILDLNSDGEDLYEIKIASQYFLYEDFEDDAIGSQPKPDGFFVWSSMGDKGSVKVAGDESNKFAHFKGTYVEGGGTNMLFQSDSSSICLPTVLSFDLKVNTNPHSRFELHMFSSSLSQKVCAMVFAGSRISCFEDYQKRIELDSTHPLVKGERVRVALKIDPQKEVFGLYLNGKLLREADFDTITKYKRQTTPSSPEFDVDWSDVVFRLDSICKSDGENVDTEIDNFVIYNYVGNSDELFMSKPQISESGKKVSAYAEILGENKGKYDCYMAIYKGNKLLHIASETIDFESEISRNLIFELPERADGSEYQVKMFVWKNEGVPDKKAVSFIGKEPDLPYENEIRELLGKEKSHPYIAASPEDFERIDTLKETDENVKKWYADVLAKADRICTYSIDTRKWYNTPEQFYYIYYEIPDGVRLLNMSARAADFIETLSFAYKFTGDSKYAERATEIMMRVCGEGELGFSDWNPSHFLDVSSMCEGVATGYDLLYDYLSDSQKEYILNALSEKALVYGINSYKNNSFWTKDISNWNPAVNMGLIKALLCCYGKDADFDSQLEYLAGKIMHSIVLSIDTFYPDGAWYEGPRYAPVHNIVAFVDTVERAFGTDFGYLERSGFEKSADYYTYVDGPDGVHNYSDCIEYELNSPVLFSLAHRFGNAYLQNKQLSRQGLGSVSALLWYRPMNLEETKAPKDAYFRDVEMVTMRQNPDDENALWLSLCGGKTSHSHAHYDSGNFVLDYAGYRWASDLGSDTTNTTHYSTTYYFLEAYRCRAEGHNVPVINPDSDPGQVDGFARVEKSSLNTDSPYAVVNLSSVYDKADASKVKRGYRLINNRSTVLIRDEYTLSKSGEIYWFMHTRADAKIEDGKVILTNPDGVKMKLEFLSENSESEIYITDAAPMTDKGSPDPEWQGKNPNFKKVAIKLTGNGNVNLSVMISPYETATDITGVNSVERW